MAATPLESRDRPVEQPEGLLVLHHGRGTNENDLIPLADALDPERRLHAAAPRGPLRLEGWPGFHWYVVPRVGYPDPETFRTSFDSLAAFHDELWERTGVPPERTVLGGFSMGSVMSYALGLDGGRPRPAGLMIFSGFVPIVEGWEPDLASRQGLPVFVAHGRSDPIMEIGFAQRARELLEAGGLDVTYRESDGGHTIDPSQLAEARGWLSRVVPG